jgi:hypothetical protein
MSNFNTSNHPALESKITQQKALLLRLNIKIFSLVQDEQKHWMMELVLWQKHLQYHQDENLKY